MGGAWNNGRMREFSMGVDDDAARCGHDPVDSLLGRLLKLPKGEGTNAGRGVPSRVHVWLAFVGGRNAASRITGPVFQLCRYALGCEGPFEESAVKGSNNINLEQGLSCVNAIRKRRLFD